ncbi:MAG: amino acid adenylation domain-containing protein, partial [Cyclobacteriaceae bacterium]
IINNKTEIIGFLKGRFSGIQSISPIEKQSSYPLSNAQSRIWMLSQFKDGSVAYNMPQETLLNKDLDINYLQQAIEATIDRHEILRTVFKEDQDGEIRQWILSKDELGFSFDYKDYRDAIDSQDSIRNYIATDSIKPFDLEKGPLLRAAFLRFADDAYIFYFNMHHIISDGWSMTVFYKDVFAFYTAYLEKKELSLSELSIQYKDYAFWQLNQLSGDSFKADQSFWLDNLSGELPLLELPTNQSRPGFKTYNGRGLGTFLPKKTVAKLKSYNQNNGGSLFMGLLAAWNVLMNRYTSQKDIIIGTPTAGRIHANLEDQIGFYVNTLALRNSINPEEDFHTIYKRISENAYECYSHQMYPFDKLVEDLNLKRDTSRHPVFDIMLILHNHWGNTERFDISEEHIDEVVDKGYQPSRFDIEVAFHEKGEFLSFDLIYNTDLYDYEMVVQLMGHYKQLLDELLSKPGQKISQISYLSDDEYKTLTETFNATSVDYSKRTIKALFEEQVRNNLDKQALVFEGQSLTYHELNTRSNVLANYLSKEYGITKGFRIGVLLDRCIESVISMLAVIKTGACYVSIDPNYPTDRVTYIIKDSNAEVIISTVDLQNKHNIASDKFSDIAAVDFNDQLADNPDVINDPSDECYVIYTSGSTGTPKGVIQTHRMMSNLVEWDVNDSGLERNLKHLQYVSFSFDVHTQDCWSALCGGGTIYMAHESIRLDFTALWSFIEDSGIELLSFPFSAFQQLIGQNSHKGFSLPFLKHVICSGEQLVITPSIQQFFESNRQVWLHNHYGPSETQLVTSYTLKGESGIDSDSEILIGGPVANCQIYILDSSMHPVAQGVEGELYIGGYGLAKGYLNKEELTKKKFVKSPFVSGEYLFKSGDLGRWTTEGEIRYTGRIDDQVKVRGYRMELGEIAQSLSRHEMIEKSVVLVKENEEGEKELVAYLVAKAEQNASDLRAYLRESLPDYMLPTYYVQIPEFPLTSNGKLDKRALPSPKGLGLSSGIEYVPPGSELEKSVVEIWEKVLQKERIGIKDDFFTLGGHSLKAVRLINEYQKVLAAKLSLEELFINTTVELHVSLLMNSAKEEFIEIKKIDPRESYKMSDSQRRLWSLSQFEESSVAYNLPGHTFLDQSINVENF